MSAEEVPMRPYLKEIWSRALQANDPLIDNEQFEFAKDSQDEDTSSPRSQESLGLVRQVAGRESQTIADIDSDNDLAIGDSKSSEIIEILQSKVQMLEMSSGPLVYDLLDSFIEILSDANFERKKQKYLKALKRLSLSSSTGETINQVRQASPCPASPEPKESPRPCPSSSLATIDRKNSFTVDPKEISHKLKRPNIDKEVGNLYPIRSEIQLDFKPPDVGIGDSKLTGKSKDNVTPAKPSVKDSGTTTPVLKKYATFIEPVAPLKCTYQIDVPMSQNAIKPVMSGRLKKTPSTMHSPSALKAMITIKDIKASSSSCSSSSFSSTTTTSTTSSSSTSLNSGRARANANTTAPPQPAEAAPQPQRPRTATVYKRRAAKKR